MLKSILNEAKITPKRFQGKIEKLQDQLQLFDELIMDYQDTDLSDDSSMDQTNKELQKMYKPMDVFKVRLEAVKTALRKSQF